MSGMRVRLEFGGARQRVVSVAFGLLRLTRRDRHPGARRQRPSAEHQPVVVDDGLVGPATGGSEIPVCQRGFGIPDALQSPPRHHSRQSVLAGGLARLVRRRDIPGGQGRASQRQVPETRAPPAKLRAALKGGLGRRPGRGRLTLARQCHALGAEADHPPRSRREPPRPRRPPRRTAWRLRLNRRRHLRQRQVKATQTRVEPVADRVGEVAPFFGGRAHRERVTRDVGAPRLHARIWLSRHRSSTARARPIASAKHSRASSTL